MQTRWLEAIVLLQPLLAAACERMRKSTMRITWFVLFLATVQPKWSGVSAASLVDQSLRPDLFRPNALHTCWVYIKR
jgi:hypothetical protein